MSLNGEIHVAVLTVRLFEIEKGVLQEELLKATANFQEIARKLNKRLQRSEHVVCEEGMYPPINVRDRATNANVPTSVTNATILMNPSAKVKRQMGGAR